MADFDVCIVGAGVVGLAVARALGRLVKSKPRVLLLEQETGFGQHLSSRNSEVIHAGLYYPENSLKAKLCVRGKALLYDYCAAHSIPHQRLGKLIVAQAGQESGLESLLKNAEENGVNDLIYIEKKQLLKRYPELRGEAALLSPSTGIIDSHALMSSLLHEAEREGVTYVRGTRVVRVDATQSPLRVTTESSAQPEEFFTCSASLLINCAGLDAHRLAAQITGADPLSVPRVWLCKGDYFHCPGGSPFPHLVYPLPDPNASVLGIHATVDLGGQLRFGPDAQFVSTMDLNVDLAKADSFRAVIANYYPGIARRRLEPAYSGIRPKLHGPGGGPADFQVQCLPAEGPPRIIQLFGIESPGLTSALALAEHVLQKANLFP